MYRSSNNSGNIITGRPIQRSTSLDQQPKEHISTIRAPWNSSFNFLSTQKVSGNRSHGHQKSHRRQVVHTVDDCELTLSIGAGDEESISVVDGGSSISDDELRVAALPVLGTIIDVGSRDDDDHLACSSTRPPPAANAGSGRGRLAVNDDDDTEMSSEMMSSRSAAAAINLDLTISSPFWLT
ncbi:hypothetical protein GUJ93_ZPchr0006g42716 [Zizania palustris]|nr:hypothetical protein GUJ93_ZPchr0006g42716 [Zizania palustris]